MISGNSHKQVLAGGLSALALLCADIALAGSATVESANGEPVVFEYADGDKLRVNTSEENAYMVVRDNTMYSVIYNDGEPMVVNASTMMKGFADMAGMAGQAAPSGATSEVLSIEATGRRETVAGITGEIHEMTTLEDGREITREVVMSSDPRALELRDAMYTMVRASAGMLDEEGRRNSQDFHDRLGELDMGILRYGTEMRIAAIDGDTVAASRFELPAEPVDMSDLGGLMGAMGEGSAPGAGSGRGGMFSGMMERLGGGRVDAEEVEAEAEAEVEAEAESEEESSRVEDAGKAVGGALRRLFGDG